jgi:O-antigen ligase
LANSSSISKSQIQILGLGILGALMMGLFIAMIGGLADTRKGILLGLPAGLIVGLFFLYNRYALLLIIVFLRSSLDLVFDATKLGDFGLGAVLNGLVILIALIALAEKPDIARKIAKDVWLPFLIISLATLTIAPDLVSGIKTYIALLTYASIFFLAVKLIKTEEDYGRWMKAILLSSLIPVIYGFIDAATGGVAREEGFRIRSTFSHPNIFAFYLVLMLTLVFYFMKAKVSFIPEWIRKTLPIYLFLMMALLLMTKTRSAWLACFVFFLIYAFLYDRKYLIWIALIPLISLMIPEIMDRITDLGQGYEVINYSKLNSYAWRMLIWHDGLNWMMPSHYMFGYGLESFKFKSVDFFTMSSGMPNGAHNIYVQIFFETGLLGLLAYIWIYFKTAKILLPFYKVNPLMIFIALMLLIEAATESYTDNMLVYLSFNWYLWFVLGAIYAVNYLSVPKVSIN